MTRTDVAEIQMILWTLVATQLEGGFRAAFAVVAFIAGIRMIICQLQGE